MHIYDNAPKSPYNNNNKYFGQHIDKMKTYFFIYLSI